MFRSFFGLTDRPYGKTPDPTFLFESRSHREALARLEYAVEEMELALLTGPIGSGKTLVTRALLDRVGDSRRPVLLVHPRLSPSQLLASIAEALGGTKRRGRADLIGEIQTRLYELHEAGTPAVLILDEAQLVPTKSVFDEIRLLTNFQLDDRNLLAIVLVGQPELEARLRRREYEALRQRIGIRYSLQPLDEADTAAYLAHRFERAGGKKSPFTAAAAARVHVASAGVPRLINALATTCLLEAMGREKKTIDVEIVDAAARELDLPVEAPRLKAVKHG